MAQGFKKAQRKGIYARIALCGPTGSGKTWTALELATGLANGKRIALIDTERSSSDRYADVFDFDSINLESFSPDTYVETMRLIEPEVYGVTIIDSLSHAWIGKDGALEQVDKTAARSQSNNKFVAWREVTPMHNRLVEALLSMKTHLIVTMRSKMEYIMEEDERGKKAPRRVGMAPIQRDGLEYEFDIVGDMNLDNVLSVSKTRASFLNRAVIQRPDRVLGEKILEWCGTPSVLVTEGTLREIVEVCKAKSYDPAKITELSRKMFAVGPREMTVEQAAQLKLQVETMAQ